MNMHDDAIANLAYSQLMISCSARRCAEILDKILDQPATEPVEDWAVDMAKCAYRLGWTTGENGCVLCPIHSAEDESNYDGVES